ncbi:hypothetical protein BGZ89_006277 [Linnemannia elongata]|nr:hypothetical protein BGZ89_006277 [Linnemannia elongata]
MVKETELDFCITSLKLGSRELGNYIVEALEDMRFMFEEVRKIEKAEAAQAAMVAAAAEALSHAERSGELAMASKSMNPTSPSTAHLRDGRVGVPDYALIARSPSPARPPMPAPRTSLFFQKHDPVLRTALARNAMAMAQEKYWSGIDEIAFDIGGGSGSPVPPKKVLSTSPPTSTTPTPAAAAGATTTTTDAGAGERRPSTGQAVNGTRPRSDSGTQRTFMAILMGEDGILSRLRSRRGASNLSKDSSSPPNSPK